jgi:hypothetical protein
VSAWSIFTHDDLPPLSGDSVPSPLPEPLPEGEVSIRPGEEPSDFDVRRIERQGSVAKSLRGAAEREAVQWRRRRLCDYALLIEVAESADDALVLLGEVEHRFGLRWRP